MRMLAQNLQLFHRYFVDLIEHIDAGYVHPRSLDHINQIVHRSVWVSDIYFSVRYLVLRADGADQISIQMFLGMKGLNEDAAFLLLRYRHIRLGLVQPNTKALQLVLNLLFKRNRLTSIENEQDDVAGAGGTDNLSTAAFPIFSALDDTWQIKNLEFRSLVA